MNPKPPPPPNPQKVNQASFSDPASLSDIAKLIPEEQPATPEIKPRGATLPGESGGVTDILLVIIDFSLELNGLTPLTDQQKSRFSDPMAKIEAQYAPQVISKYAGTSAPFLDLLLVSYSIFKDKRQELAEKKKKEPEPEPEPPPPAQP
jgi:hypothetical protein